jgi:hypothetical protein
MDFAVKYHQLATPVVKLQFREGASRADWTIDPLPHPAIGARLYRFIVETQFGMLVSLHRDIMGSTFYPSSLEVTFCAARVGRAIQEGGRMSGLFSAAAQLLPV